LAEIKGEVVMVTMLSSIPEEALGIAPIVDFHIKTPLGELVAFNGYEEEHRRLKSKDPWAYVQSLIGWIDNLNQGVDPHREIKSPRITNKVIEWYTRARMWPD
jgi:hypothetical protein